MRKYILIISAVYKPEPVVSARLSSDMYDALIEMGHEVRVLHPKPTRPFGFKFDESITWNEDEIVVDSYTCASSSIFGRTRESISFGHESAKYIRNHCKEISIVYAGGWPLFGQYFIIKECLKYHIPTITPVQDVYPESLSNKIAGIGGKLIKRAFLPIDKYVLRHSNHIHVISEKMRDYLSDTRKIPQNRFEVVINWQDETEFLNYEKLAKEDSLVNGKFTFMYMGNIGPVAGVDLLIDAFELAQIDNARLVIAGSGSMKATLQERANNNTNIEFWEVPNGKVPEIQSRADVMMLPIKKGAASSSIPSKLPAYMFSAKPIIGCMDNDSDTAYAIRESGAGFVIEPERPELLSQLMKKVSELERSELEDMGKKGFEYGMAHFSKEVNLKKCLNLFRF